MKHVAPKIVHSTETAAPQPRFKGLRHFVAAWSYSWAGLRVAVKETAVKQELCLGIINCICTFAISLTVYERLLALGAWLIILLVEVLNTAIESVVNLVCPGYNELAKHAKDLGSAAVFLAFTLFVLIWGGVGMKHFFL